MADQMESPYELYNLDERIVLKINKMSQFAVGNADTQRRYSEPVQIRGIPWRILALPRELSRRRAHAGGAPTKYLGFFLQCNFDDNDLEWSCVASARLRILAQREAMEDHVRNIFHTFTALENDWGFAQFMSMELMMDVESGWYDAENDTLILAVDVMAQAPQGIKEKIGGEQSPTGKALLQQLLEQQKGTDVKFLVGSGDTEQTFSAHKLILSTASPVFDAQFNFGDIDFTQPIVVPVVEPDAFRLMLHYIYTSGLGKEKLTGDNVFPVLYTARKYNIVGLRRACIDFDFGFDPKNVLTVLEQAHFFDEELLICRCFRYIDKNAKNVLENLWEFPNLDKALLAKMLARDTLEMEDEYLLFNMISLWVENKYGKNNPNNGGDDASSSSTDAGMITKENRRRIFDELLGPALFAIRFPLISQDNFVRDIVPLELLTKDELISVFIHHSGHGHTTASKPLPFSTKKRGAQGGQA